MLSKKKMKQIKNVIDEACDLNNVSPEFEGFFKDPPDMWRDEEKALCDYIAKIQMQINSNIKKLFGKE